LKDSVPKIPIGLLADLKDAVLATSSPLSTSSSATPSDASRGHVKKPSSDYPSAQSELLDVRYQVKLCVFLSLILYCFYFQCCLAYHPIRFLHRMPLVVISSNFTFFFFSF
jgi:hypothetical protein